ncbi:bacillithiol system redox-active protein YtxJ [Marinoscillum sp.]|uniref:bacillithiol system redox-active protein YtxJ n=1 Tax=Marinoscillum sp. TaxID=2024838 RepID=UPI003BAA3FF3
MTEINWNPLTSIDQLEEINTLSHTQPVVIFKHSTRCSISAASLSRLERKWDNQKVGELRPYFLDLIAYREVSNQIAERFGVDHQSPQVLIIQNGKSIYDNSHFGISFDEIVENIKPISA